VLFNGGLVILLFCVLRHCVLFLPGMAFQSYFFGDKTVKVSKCKFYKQLNRLTYSDKMHWQPFLFRIKSKNDVKLKILTKPVIPNKRCRCKDFTLSSCQKKIPFHTKLSLRTRSLPFITTNSILKRTISE